jgi:DNA-binding transcriptional regulator YiaG
MNNPTPEKVKQARKDAGLTQTAAGAVLYSTCRAWQKWEKGEARMHQAMFELFMIKVEQNG